MYTNEDLINQIKAQFDLKCKKCGSLNVEGSIEPGIDYGGMTGWQSGTISIGCNECKENDFHSYI